MNTTLLPYGIYKSGDNGYAVVKIQQVLLSLGYNIKVDGIFSEQTESVILNLKRKYPERLISDSIYDSATRAQLMCLIESNYNIVQNSNDVLALVNKQNSLPHDYIPDDLVVPNVPFSFNEFLPKKLMRKVAAIAIEQLFYQAQKDFISITAVSGYRSYYRQSDIFASNIKASPDANETSARPGESEHQTGLSMDVSSPSVDNQLTQIFGVIPEGLWLEHNAPKHGFIIRFPKEKEDITGYQYEPWHIRYVGIPTAQIISHRNLTLEEYLHPNKKYFILA